jgi:hypothetical protein
MVTKMRLELVRGFPHCPLKAAHYKIYNIGQHVSIRKGLIPQETHVDYFCPVLGSSGKNKYGTSSLGDSRGKVPREIRTEVMHISPPNVNYKMKLRALKNLSEMWVTGSTPTP